MIAALQRDAKTLLSKLGERVGLSARVGDVDQAASEFDGHRRLLADRIAALAVGLRGHVGEASSRPATSKSPDASVIKSLAGAPLIATPSGLHM